MNEIAKLMNLYQHAPLTTRLHVRGRWQLFPFPALAEYLPGKGVLLDIGCGHGLWAFYAALLRPDCVVWGVDPDEEKTAIAQGIARAQGWERVHFVAGLAAQAELPSADRISLIDVLYLIPHLEQERLLESAVARLNQGGKLLLKEMSQYPRWKFAWNWLEEWLAVRMMGITFGKHFYFRTEQDWQQLLQNLGLKVKIVYLDQGYLHPHILFVGEKI